MSETAVNVVYVAASAHDGRFARTCVASIRFFYPDIPIQLLVGGPLERGLAEELNSGWNVTIADLPRRDYGWGFVKLEPLFMPPGHAFLVLDADTVLSGPVLDLARDRDADLIVDDERQGEANARRIYYDWLLSAERGGVPLVPPVFLFNTGQWFGVSGRVPREAFAGLVDWSGPTPKLRHPQVFKNGEQGVLNFIVNQMVHEGSLKVCRVPLLCWPGHGMQGITAASIAGGQAPTRVTHWAGYKGARHGSLPGGDVLMFFENLYYSRLGGAAERRIASCRHAARYIVRDLRLRGSQRLNMTLGRGTGSPKWARRP